MIKSDKWIRRQCLKPKHIRVVNRQPVPLIQPYGFEDCMAIDHLERNDLGRPLSNAEIEMIAQRGMVLAYTEEVEALYPWLPMIEPFEPSQVRHKEVETFAQFPEQRRLISYGTSSYGYDIRCADEFKVFTNINSTIVDPKNFDPKSFVDVKGDYCIIPPNSFALARTVEYFRIPRNVFTVCLGKSTYARCGIVVNVTPFEPEWEGYVTLEFSNTTPLPAKIYAGEGCAQVLFFESDEVCETSYKDRNGKYQGQTGVVTPRT